MSAQHGTAGGDSEGDVTGKEEEEIVNPIHAMFGEPIIGVEQIVWDENGPGAKSPSSLPKPKGMTPQEWAMHVVTHLPYNCSCPICVAARRPNTHHRKSPEGNRIIDGIPKPAYEVISNFSLT